ncbi:MAG: DNA alkylation repair protein [Alistipes sp.]|nr:DNA alkylation repair protein [Alistipes sp.]
MADQTQKMISLLGRMRKQMNGAVADAMYYYGQNYGLNYGVSLPTVREIASAEGKDHELARYLYKQQVRELRLAAMHIAEPALFSLEEASAWADGIINSELAEEMAFALLPHSTALKEIYAAWTTSGNEFMAYSALMAASRTELAAEQEIIHSINKIVSQYPASRIIAQGAVALLSSAATLNADRSNIEQALQQLPECSASDYIREEMEWRLEALQ